MWNSHRARAPGKTLAATLVIATVLLLASCGGYVASGGAADNSAGGNPALSKVALEVPTIWCSTCKPRVEASARSVPGVVEVKFDAERIEIVTVTYDSAQTTLQAIVEAIERGGDSVARVTKL